MKPSNLAVPLLILFVALSSRVVSLGTMLTFDEPYWITRSLTFFQALWEHDWAATYQTAHPGVSTMWLSGASLWLLSKPGMPGESQLILGVLPIALTTALAVVLMYWLSKKIFGVRIAAVGALLVALDPYYIAYSRVIHLDALLATFMILSVLATITYLSVEEKRYLALAGAFVGLALLTKFGPALLLVIFVPIAIFVWGIWKTRDAEGTSEVGPRVTRILLSVLRESGLVFLVAIATFLVLWPATWVQPTQVVVSLVQNLQHVETTPHGSGFFMGQVSNGDYPLSFYPVVMLMRSTPVTLILSAVCLAGFAAACLIRKAQNKHKAIVLLFLYVAAFIAAISLAATKFDRYALPAFPAIDLVAGVGAFELVAWLGRLGRPMALRRPRLKTVMTWAVLTVVVLSQACSALSVHPYYLAYYNPAVFGGPAHAPEILTVGWGEGMDLAAQYLNGKPNAETLTVAAQYPGFSVFFKGKTVGMNDLSGADYVVFYVSTIQREWNNDVWTQYRDREPEKVIVVNGMTYCWIYPVTH